MLVIYVFFIVVPAFSLRFTKFIIFPKNQSLACAFSSLCVYFISKFCLYLHYFLPYTFFHFSNLKKVSKLLAFLLFCYKTISFPLTMALVSSYKFYHVVIFSSFDSKYFLISDVISYFTNVLFKSYCLIFKYLEIF